MCALYPNLMAQINVIVFVYMSVMPDGLKMTLAVKRDNCT